MVQAHSVRLNVIISFLSIKAGMILSEISSRFVRYAMHVKVQRVKIIALSFASCMALKCERNGYRLMNKKSPSFQFYPDKALAGTVHLSPAAFKAYWMILWWMWLHSKTGYTMPNTTNAWKMATLIHNNRMLDAVRKEILAPEFKLLRKSGLTLVSFGLKKERKKQLRWAQKSRIGGKLGASRRWGKDLCNDSQNGGGHKMAIGKNGSPSPTPSLTPLNTFKNVLNSADGVKLTEEIQKATQRFLINCGELMGNDKRCTVSKEQILQDRSTLVSLAIFLCTNYGMGEWNSQLDRAYNSLEEQIDNTKLRRPMAAFTSAARRMWSEWKYGRTAGKRK